MTALSLTRTIIMSASARKTSNGSGQARYGSSASDGQECDSNRGWIKSIIQAPFSCFSARSTLTLFLNIQFSESYSDFLVTLFLLCHHPTTLSSVRCEHSPDDSLIAHDLPFNRPSAAMQQAFTLLVSITATFSSNGLIINENILKVENTAAHLQLQTIDSQSKSTEGGNREQAG